MVFNQKKATKPMDPKRPHNPNSTFSKKPGHRRQRQHRQSAKRNQKLDIPVKAVISDGQRSIRIAVK